MWGKTNWSLWRKNALEVFWKNILVEYPAQLCLTKKKKDGTWKIEWIEINYYIFILLYLLKNNLYFFINIETLLFRKFSTSKTKKVHVLTPFCLNKRIINSHRRIYESLSTTSSFVFNILIFWLQNSTTSFLCVKPLKVKKEEKNYFL